MANFSNDCLLRSFDPIFSIPILSGRHISKIRQKLKKWRIKIYRDARAFPVGIRLNVDLLYIFMTTKTLICDSDKRNIQLLLVYCMYLTTIFLFIQLPQGETRQRNNREQSGRCPDRQRPCWIISLYRTCLKQETKNKIITEEGKNKAKL